MPDEPIAGRYRLLEPLGRGAMSSVWLAEDEELGRRVAVKMLAPNADRERFAREARAVAALSHPNICALFDYGEADGRPFMVLEHLPNGSLEDRLRASAPFADGDTRLLAAEVAAGLAHAHERGLVHRDLKPANILFDAEDRPKIADFGIARMGGSGTLTEAGTVLGTATYISPEQASGAPAGPASDVYSFGVILFRMLTGRLPFASQNAMELVRMHRDAPAPAVEEVRADAPADLTALVAAALRKDPAARPADGAALLAALGGGRLVAPDETAATRILAAPPPSPAPRRRRRTPAVLAALALLLLVAGGAVALALTRNGDSTPPAPTTAPGLELPSVPTSSTAPPASTETTATTEQSPTTTARTTTAPTTTAPTTTAAATTAPATTARTTTAPPPTTTATLPTTTEPPPTTTEPLPTTTAAVTTAPTTTTTITVP
jgi:serine/threonine-protein kinase